MIMCDKAPKGWRCLRYDGHDGPCMVVVKQKRPKKWYDKPWIGHTTQIVFFPSYLTLWTIRVLYVSTMAAIRQFFNTSSHEFNRAKRYAVQMWKSDSKL